jgi:aminopeptidase N
LADLLRRDVDNPWMRIAALSSLDQGRGAVVVLLLSDEGYRNSEQGAALLVTLAEQIGHAGRESELNALMNAVQRLDEAGLERRLVRAVLSSGNRASRDRLLSGSERAREILEQLLASANDQAFDEKQNASRRATAVRTLQLADRSVPHAIGWNGSATKSEQT